MASLDLTTWLVTGASSGLGEAFLKNLSAQADDLPSKIICVSRRPVKTEISLELSKKNISIKHLRIDLSNPSEVDNLVREISDKSIRRFLSFAAGGPYGEYSTKQFKDHEWAFNVNFLAPAKILHSLLNQKTFLQCVLVGSAIAESKADPMAAAYSAAKHAVKGLYATLATESAAETSGKDIRLFSPGYMDTPLLPPGSWPRKTQGEVMDAQIAAAKLYDWMLTGERGTHLLFDQESKSWQQIPAQKIQQSKT